MSDDKDLYAVLGVPPSAGADEIRSAYRSAAKREHPDRFASYVQKARATVRMQQLNRAYAVLRNAEGRRTYDATRASRRAQMNTRVKPRGHSQSAAPSAAAPAPVDGSAWWVGGWLLASSIFAYFMWLHWGSPLGFGLVYIVIVSLTVAPLVCLLAAASLALPIFVVGIAFKSAFAERRAAVSLGFGRIVVDFVTRAAALTAGVWLLVKAFQWSIQSDLLYLMLLAFCGGAAGELTAMLVYIFFGLRVVKVTSALVRGSGMDLTAG